ncbi:hypothetical protein ATANTOWER_011226 [Ataeniobius toweri]|uniref:Secreted protein n=1 Tax=Ataeniobius toweri TaxID=208326 RepID=A0ABU7BJK6_9TELE|nr:hypothetical protein [Ataeniobius toweri]
MCTYPVQVIQVAVVLFCFSFGLRLRNQVFSDICLGSSSRKAKWFCGHQWPFFISSWTGNRTEHKGKDMK